jgi:hypothetical protein
MKKAKDCLLIGCKHKITKFLIKGYKVITLFLNNKILGQGYKVIPKCLLTPKIP